MLRENDKRVIRTKNAIRKAFNELVQDKDISAISVSELVKKASITRSTFYMYYSSVLDVRDEIEQEIFVNLDRIMSDGDWLNFMLDPYPLLSRISQELMRYDEYNRFLLSTGDSRGLFDRLNKRVIDVFLQYIEKRGLNIDGARAKYIAVFIAAGIEESFRLWYNHQSSLTLEELCRRMSELIKAGLRSIRGGAAQQN